MSESNAIQSLDQSIEGLNLVGRSKLEPSLPDVGLAASPGTPTRNLQEELSKESDIEMGQ